MRLVAPNTSEWGRRGYAHDHDAPARLRFQASGIGVMLKGDDGETEWGGGERLDCGPFHEGHR